jgi:hypothetical protein
MLLSSVVQAMRKQDWFTVFVELFVLIIGVFIGLQVDDWNQRRLDRIEEAYYIDRLTRDMRQSLIDQEAALDRADVKFRDSLAVLRALEAGSLGDMTANELNDRLSRLRGYPRFTLITATIDELVSTGKVSLLRSNELREKIAEFVDWYGDQERYYVSLSGAITDAYAMQYRFLEPDWTDSDNPRSAAQFDDLVNDPDALYSMRQLTAVYWVLRRDLGQLYQETEKVYEALAGVAQTRM